MRERKEMREKEKEEKGSKEETLICTGSLTTNEELYRMTDSRNLSLEIKRNTSLVWLCPNNVQWKNAESCTDMDPKY